MSKKRAYGADVQCLAAFEATYGSAPNGGGGGVYTRMSFGSTDIGAETMPGTLPHRGAPALETLGRAPLEPEVSSLRPTQ